MNILYVQAKVGDEVYKKRLKVILPEKLYATFIKTEFPIIKSERENQEQKLLLLHHFRDETIQISAILQTVFVQGLSGTPPLQSGPFGPGIYSLLGLGGVYAGLFSVYHHVRSAFDAVSLDRLVCENFSTQPSPGLPHSPDDKGYDAWKQKLQTDSQFKNIAFTPTPTPRVEQLLYFSNRLGFRATKLSITAAYQSIPLSYNPAWSLVTLFHEFLHAHLKPAILMLCP